MNTRRIIVPPAIACFLLASFFLSLSTVIFSATEVIADSRYVIPSAEVVLKSGAGREFRVIGVVKDGDSVEFLEEDGSYARVRVANGKEGWMLKRYLSVQPPPSTIVASLRAENEQLKQKELELSQQFSEVSANLDKSKNELNSILNEKNQVATKYQNLQQDTADVIKIKNDMLAATQQNEELTQEITALKEENDKLNKDKSINWFMAGGGVLLVGMILGSLSSKSRKRKSSLM